MLEMYNRNMNYNYIDMLRYKIVQDIETKLIEIKPFINLTYISTKKG